MSPVQFSAAERHVLLCMAGIGDVVVARLEQVGFTSLRQLQEAGVDSVIDRVQRRLGVAWGNRRGALQRALRSAGADA